MSDINVLFYAITLFALEKNQYALLWGIFVAM